MDRANRWVPVTEPEERGFDDLVGALRRERDRLEHLRFRFVTLDLLLRAGEARYWTWAVQDLNRARIRVREADLTRAAEVESLTLPTLGAGASLREVAAAMPAPWSGMLRDHHDSFSTLVTEIEVHAHSIAQAGRDALAELARTGTLSVPTPDHRVLVPCHGGADASVTSVDDERLRAPGCADPLDPVSLECVLGDVIASGGRLRIPALLAFLR